MPISRVDPRWSVRISRLSFRPAGRASKLADSVEAAAVLVLAEHVYDFLAIRAAIETRPSIIASNKQEIVEAAKKEGLSEVLRATSP